jgi:hypothetical protein
MPSGDPRVGKLYCDMYEGDGKDNPPMTVRVDRLEQWYKEARDDARWTKRFAITQGVGLALYFIAHLFGWKL